MRSIKLSVIAATTIASLGIASSALADDTTVTSTTSTTTTTPAAPAPVAPAPVQMTPPPAVVPPASGPTSTTSTTSADTDYASTRRSNSDTVIYDKHVPNKAVLITGGALLVGTYATTAAITAGNGSVKDHDLYIPVAGPWIDLASRSWSTTSTTDTVLIMGSGILQGVGAGMAVASFFIPEKTPVATIAVNAGPVKMQLTPTAGAGTGGVGAIGTF